MLPPRAPARSVLTVFTSVPVRSLTVTVSAPPRALKSTRFDAGGVHRDGALGAEEPEAVAVRRQVDLLGAAGAVEEHRVGAVLALDDVAAVAWIPDEGVVAGAQERDVVAAVAVDRVVPVAAEQRSRFPGPPASVSFPSPPSSVVGMLSVKAPLLSSMRTRSSPARASTAIFAILLRSKLKSAEPSSPTSTWRIAGLPACRRSAILSLTSVPLIVRTPCLSFGCLNRTFLDGCETFSALIPGAAFPCPAAIPVAPATAVARATAEAAKRAARDAFSRMRLFIGACLLSGEPRAAHGSGSSWRCRLPLLCRSGGSARSEYRLSDALGRCRSSPDRGQALARQRDERDPTPRAIERMPGAFAGGRANDTCEDSCAGRSCAASCGRRKKLPWPRPLRDLACPLRPGHDPAVGLGRVVEHCQVFEQVSVGIAEVDGGGGHPADDAWLVGFGCEERERRYAQ